MPATLVRLKPRKTHPTAAERDLRFARLDIARQREQLARAKVAPPVELGPWRAASIRAHARVIDELEQRIDRIERVIAAQGRGE